MRVLVTGSSGQLGAQVCRQLSGTHTVTGLDAAPGPFTQDCAWAHQLALESPVRFGLYNISARSPFQREDLTKLWSEAAQVIRRRAPQEAALLAQCGIALPARLDRVYVIARAQAELGFHPRFNALEFLRELSRSPRG
jgi:nucleoside-diphosphate-sugar epimerase